MLIAPQQELKLLSTNVPDNTEPTYDDDATYNTGDKVQLNGRLYICRADDTSGINPEDDPITWVYLGAVNKMAMFDVYMNSTTLQNTEVTTIRVEGDETSIITVGSTLTGNESDAEGTVEAVYYCENDDKTIVFFSTTSGTFETDETVNNGTDSTTGSITSVDLYPKPIIVRVAVSDADALALFGVTANAVQVVVKDNNSDNEILNTLKLLTTYNITDWYEWTYAKAEYKKDLYFELPMVFDGELTVYIYPNGNPVECKHMTYGQTQQLGVTLWGVTVSRRSNAYKERSPDGHVYIKKGISWKRMTVPVSIDTANADSVERRLGAIDGVPTLFIGDEREGGFESLLIFGFFRDFDIPISLRLSKYQIEIEGVG